MSDKDYDRAHAIWQSIHNAYVASTEVTEELKGATYLLKDEYLGDTGINDLLGMARTMENVLIELRQRWSLITNSRNGE